MIPDLGLGLLKLGPFVASGGRVRRVEAEASVKLRMVERGYTPEQIAQAVLARMAFSGGTR